MFLTFGRFRPVNFTNNTFVVRVRSLNVLIDGGWSKYALNHRSLRKWERGRPQAGKVNRKMKGNSWTVLNFLSFWFWSWFVAASVVSYNSTLSTERKSRTKYKRGFWLKQNKNRIGFLALLDKSEGWGGQVGGMIFGFSDAHTIDNKTKHK